ncbi:MAG: helix-turn-helix domain-containing protein [SAR202 cluster bacterium]|jgi:excisionase family DNA binding protein|nr:helix-turn-helix domain-containing protein [SAR202 cluster bacterium]
MTASNRNRLPAFNVPAAASILLQGTRRPGIASPAQAPSSPWLDVKAAGAYVGFCEKTIRRACATGGLRHVRRGRRIRTQRAWLDEWMLAHNE